MKTYKVFAHYIKDFDKSVEFSYIGKKLLKVGDIITIKLDDNDEIKYKILKHTKISN